jgi:hypothetical protein
MTIVLFSLLLSLPPSICAESFVETWLDSFGDEVSEYAGSTIFPLLDMPLGGRFEAMGGAYTAVGGDAGSLEKNPAGTALSSAPELSFFHHEWIADSAIEAVAFITSTDMIGLGAGIKYFRVPITEYDDAGERVSSGLISEVVGAVNASLRFLSSERFSISTGATVKIAYRHVPESFAPDQSVFAFPFDLGLISDLRFLDFSRTNRKNLALGLAVRNLGPIVEAFEAPLPTAISAGLSYRPFHFIMLSGDVSVPVNLDELVFRWNDLAYAVGTSVQFARFLGIHAGARIETGRPGFSLGATTTIGQISFDATYSIDLALGLNPLDSLSIGATLDLTPDKDRGSE